METADKDGNTLLHFMAASGNISILNKELDSGVNINSQNKRGQTPLHMAYKHNQQEAIVALIGRGATTDIRDSTGKTPSDYENK